MDILQIQEIGRVKEIKKSIAKIVGLSRCMIGQLVHITDNAKGIVIGFSEGEIIVFLLGMAEEVKVGDEVHSSMEPFTIPVGENFIGRVVNALAEPLDGKGPIRPQTIDHRPQTENGLKSEVCSLTSDRYPVFRRAPGVLERTPITRCLETGILSLDAVIPIGKGQRELIVGDRMTGKTSIGIDTILNQKGKDVVCIYCCIGRSYALLQKITETLKAAGALDYTIVVAAHAASPGGEQYLVPYTACTLGEYFMDRGRDVFVVFDDLTKHAWAYRQLSLLLERPPGRDAYPGDIFYLHSQLMERAGQYSPEFQGGSMTFFPIVDTLEGDVTGYIPSNLVSMTDGQIYLNTALFNSGFRPAIDLGLSVSRIGSKVQYPAIRELSGMLRLEYVRYNELLKITRFKSNIPENVAQRLREGEILTQFFSQMHHHPFPFAQEVLLLYALHRKILTALSKEQLDYFKENIFEFAQRNFPELIEEITEKKVMTPDLRQGIDECLIAFFREEDFGEVTFRG